MEVRIWKIPFEDYDILKRAFELGNYLFLVEKWNEYNVTESQLCSGCPNTIDTIERYYQEYFKVFENQ